MRKLLGSVEVCRQALHGGCWLQVVAEQIRLLLAAIVQASTEQQQQRLMAVLLMVLIADIVPRMSASAALAELAVKLVTQIASGPASAAFKAVVAGLPPQDRLKLQVRISTSASCQGMCIGVSC